MTPHAKVSTIFRGSNVHVLSERSAASAHPSDVLQGMPKQYPHAAAEQVSKTLLRHATSDLSSHSEHSWREASTDQDRR